MKNDGNYLLQLKFAELFYEKPNYRFINVTVGNVELLGDYDILSDVQLISIIYSQLKMEN